VVVGVHVLQRVHEVLVDVLVLVAEVLEIERVARGEAQRVQHRAVDALAAVPDRIEHGLEGRNVIMHAGPSGDGFRLCE
jgi:hypothetical protein